MTLISSCRDTDQWVFTGRDSCVIPHAQRFLHDVMYARKGNGDAHGPLVLLRIKKLSDTIIRVEYLYCNRLTTCGKTLCHGNTRDIDRTLYAFQERRR